MLSWRPSPGSALVSFRMTLLSSPSPCKQGLIPCFVSSPPQALVNIIKPPVRDPKGFLQLHIHRDLEHLAKTLGRSADESMSAVHVVLCGLLRGQQQRPDQCKGPGPGCLGTAAQRAGLLLTAPEGHRGMHGGRRRRLYCRWVGTCNFGITGTGVFSACV